jgi:hypothetical protein
MRAGESAMLDMSRTMVVLVGLPAGSAASGAAWRRKGSSTALGLRVVAAIIERERRVLAMMGRGMGGIGV